MRKKVLHVSKVLGMVLLGTLLVSGCTKKASRETAESQSKATHVSKEDHAHDHKHTHGQDGKFQDKEVKNRTLGRRLAICLSLFSRWNVR